MPKKSSFCKTDCCEPEPPVDCCAIPYQRLDKLRTGWSILAAAGNQLLPIVEANGDVVGPVTRGGDPIEAPVDTVFGTSGTALVTVASNVITVDLNAAYYAYLFVQTHRYLPFQECGKLDQVIGWYVNFEDGQLELFQNLCDLNLPITVNRANLNDIASADLTTNQSRQLHALNKFYKLSKRVVELVGSNQKEEGNIVELTDKCGQRWLVAVNFPSLTADTAINGCTSEFVMVAIALC